MALVVAQAQLAAPAAEVWDRAGDFNAVPQWHPAIWASRLEDDGRVRRVSVVGGGESVERLIAHDDVTRSYSYELLNGPMPVSRPRSAASCTPGWTTSGGYTCSCLARHRRPGEGQGASGSWGPAGGRQAPPMLEETGSR